MNKGFEDRGLWEAAGERWGGSEGFLGIVLSLGNAPTLLALRDGFKEKIRGAKRSSTAGRQEGGVGELRS